MSLQNICCDEAWGCSGGRKQNRLAVTYDRIKSALEIKSEKFRGLLDVTNNSASEMKLLGAKGA